MYDRHYGLDAMPFQPAPDPRFRFETASHREAMAYLGHGLAQEEGIVVVTGDVGAGKTMLIDHLLERIDPNRLAPIRLSATGTGEGDLLRAIAGALGVGPAGGDGAGLPVLIEGALRIVARTGRRTLLLVDEAQALPPSALDALRRLSEVRSGGRSPLQIVLLGQPGFRDRLQGSARLEPLRRRVIATHHLDPMAPGEVDAYVAHRLSVAGWSGRPDFTDDSFPLLFAASDGLPGRLNQLADQVLRYGAAAGVELIDAAIIAHVMARQAAGTAAATPHACPAPDGPVADQAPPDVPAAPTIEDRIAAIEARLEAQDAALRRVLTLLVDRAHHGGRAPDQADIATLRGAA